MLCIYTDDSWNQHSSEWHVGEEKPKAEAQFVTSVQADGDELHHILMEFQNLPQSTHKKVVSWYGDHAKFIVGNLT